MNKAPSPYMVDTGCGAKIQLSKGLYLTMQRRKESTFKTVRKTKPITHTDDTKKTVSKYMKGSTGRKMLKSWNNQILLRDSRNNPMIFSVGRDRDYLCNYIHIPSIQMVEDNDNETSWYDIEQNISHMGLQLSMSVYDHVYGV